MAEAAAGRRDGAADVAVLELVQQLLGLLAGDQRRVGVLVDDPLAARAALALVAVAVGAALAVHVPDGAAGVGQGVPLDADGGRGGDLEATVAQGDGARCALGAGAEIGADLVGERALAQGALQHRPAFADQAGVDVLQLVAQRRAAAGAEALAHVLGHAGRALLARGVAVHLVHGPHHGEDEDLVDGIQLRHLGVQDLDALALAVVRKGDGDVLPPRQARGIEDQQVVPAAGAVADGGAEALVARSVLVLAGLDHVGELGVDLQALGLGELLKLAALDVERDVLPVLAGP